MAEEASSSSSSKSFYLAGAAETDHAFRLHFKSGTSWSTFEHPVNRKSISTLSSLRECCGEDDCKLSSDGFSVNFEPAALGIVAQVHKYLAPTAYHVRCRISSLEFFSRGDCLDLPEDDDDENDLDEDDEDENDLEEDDARPVATLLVCVPLGFKGGDLMLKHRGKHFLYVWPPFPGGKKLAQRLNWVAYRRGARHGVTKVINGNCLLLTYELFKKALPVSSFQNSLRNVFDGYEAGVRYGFPCRFVYQRALIARLPVKDAEKIVVRMLKGVDAVLYTAAVASNHKVSVVRIWEAPGEEGVAEKDRFIDYKFLGFEKSEYVYSSGERPYSMQKMLDLGNRVKKDREGRTEGRYLELDEGDVNWSDEIFLWVTGATHLRNDDGNYSVCSLRCAVAIIVEMRAASKKRRA